MKLTIDEAITSRFYLHPTEGLTELSFTAYQDLKDQWGLPPWRALLLCFANCEVTHKAALLYSEHSSKGNTYEQLHND